jgi:hypothetical protein
MKPLHGQQGRTVIGGDGPAASAAPLEAGVLPDLRAPRAIM